MNRGWLAVVSGLIVTSSMAATAWSQSSSRQATLAERMSALRRGWSGGSQEQDTEDSSGAAHSSAAGSSTPQTQSQSQTTGNFLGRRTSQPQPNTAPRVALRQRVGSAETSSNGSSTSGFTLPGLGGSRLPSTAGNSTQQTQSPSQSPSNRGVGTRYGTPNSSTTRSAQSSPPTARRSPQNRVALNVDPKDLSRELAGSFPTEPQDDKSAEESKSENDQPSTAETPLSLPAADEDLATTPSLKVIAPSNENSHQETHAEPTPSVNLRPALNRGAASDSQRSSSKPFAPNTAGKPDPFNSAPNAANNAAANARSDSSILASQQTPMITTDIRGPRQILVGREATYRIRLNNQGAVAAENLVATIRVPNWADVIDTSTSQGTIEQSQNGNAAGALEWQLVRLDSHASETLDVRIVPRSSRPLELGVTYTVAPVGSRAIVEVQEPKLEINVTGPDEVLYGKPQVFRMTISNPGTGPAENVKIDLMPPGGGEGAVSSHPLGDLAAGASRTIEVELTPREAGKLAVKAHAAAEGGLAADADKEIFCRKPELEVDWRGPDQKYAGTQATYFFRVRNPGTAPAENVIVHVTLPDGAEYAGASEGQSLDAKRREVTWNVGALAPGDDYYMELKCLMQSPGPNQLKITASAATADLTDTKTAQTNVVALADLKLDVTDPSGPVAVGEEAVYEIRVKNRGASAAHDVNIVALFSDGVDPDQVEGALYTVTDGRVSFRTIDELPPGRQIALRIRAKAKQPGTHVFRAEVLCKDQDIKLATEETTRFYADELPPEGSAEQQHSQETPQTQSLQQQQSAERYQQAEPSAVR